MKEEYARSLLAKVRQDYDTIAEEFSDSRDGGWPEFEVFRSTLKPDQRLLDLGCGNGRVAKLLDDVKLDYLGVDVSEGLLAQAKKLNPHRKFQCASIEKIPVPDQSFDAVWCIAVLHQIPSEKLRASACAEIVRVLRPGGVLCLTVWNLWRPPYAARLRRQAFFSALHLSPMDSRDLFVRWRQSETQQYYHAFTEAELSETLSSAGLNIDRHFHTRSLKRPGQKGSDNIAVIAHRPTLAEMAAV